MASKPWSAEPRVPVVVTAGKPWSGGLSKPWCVSSKPLVVHKPSKPWGR